MTEPLPDPADFGGAEPGEGYASIWVAERSGGTVGVVIGTLDGEPLAAIRLTLEDAYTLARTITLTAMHIEDHRDT